MDVFARLLERNPVVFVHLCAALGALLLGIFILARRKGTPVHRSLGWAWVVLMGSTAATSVFVRDYGMPNIAGYTPIHLLTLLVAVQLPLGVRDARCGRLVAHRIRMKSLFFGGCVVAGAFTLLPSRFLGRWLWGTLGLL
jgi:uncharacterized membrane protein